jgi:type II secretion system protein N
MCAGIVIFYKFPYENVQGRLEALLAERWGLGLEVSDLQPSLPPKLRFSEFSLGTLDYERLPVFHADEGYLRPRILPLFGVKLAAAIRAEAYGGSLNGCVILKPLHDVRTYNLQASWQAIQLGRHRGLQLLLERRISGKLSGELELNGPVEELANSSGIGTLRLTEGSCQIDHPYLKVKTLYELEVTAAIKLDAGALKIDHCRFQARGIKGTLDGVVHLQPRLYGSVLDIAGQCQIEANLLKLDGDSNRGLVALLDRNATVPFHLRGTLTAPKLSLF